MVLLGFFTSGCGPHFKLADPQIVPMDPTAAEGLLSKTLTGNKTVIELNQLRNQGYQISYFFIDSGEIQAMNGHSGGGYKITGNTVSIYINSGLSTQEQAHVIAHEIVHINDDIEIDQFLKSYPYVSTAAQNFVTSYKTKSLDQFDQRAVSYVLGTLFCTEVRAYSRNQQMANEGLPTSYFAKGDSISEFIDQNYIAKFGTSYGASASTMTPGCLGSSMTQIQRQLVW